MSDSEEDAVETQLKIVFVGEPSVGKTSIIRRLCYEEFTRQYTSTVGAEFYIKRLVLPGKREVLLKLSDIGGLELRGSMLDKYLFNTDVSASIFELVAKHLNIPLTKMQKEHNHSVLRVELMPSPMVRPVVHVHQTKSSAACSIQ